MIEEKFCESPFIENMVVVGENRKFAAAIISPDFEFLKSWCQRHDVEYTTPEEIVKNEVIVKRFARVVDEYNQLFGETEKVKKFELAPESWTMKNGLITPTLKVKRHVVQVYYKDMIERLFQ